MVTRVTDLPRVASTNQQQPPQHKATRLLHLDEGKAKLLMLDPLAAVYGCNEKIRPPAHV